MSQEDLYAVLGVSQGANHDEIRKAYRELAVRHHPDKQPPERAEEATRKLAAINKAYTILKDEDKRRVYDMQRESSADTGGSRRHGSMEPRRPPPRSLAGVLRSVLLGRRAPSSFGWYSEVAEMSEQNAPRILRLLQLRPLLVFVHLSGSSRCEKAKGVFREAVAAVRGAAYLAALDVEAEPRLAHRLGIDQLEVPAVLLLSADMDGGTRRQDISPPITAANLVDATAGALPALRSVCSMRSLETASQRGVVRAIAVSLVPLEPKLFVAFRIGCAASHVLCATVSGRRCEIVNAYSPCDGIALLARDGRMRGCVDTRGNGSRMWELRDILHAHYTRERHGRIARAAVAAAGIASPVAKPLWRCASRVCSTASATSWARVMLRAEALPLWTALFFMATFPIARQRRMRDERRALYRRRRAARHL